MAVEPITPAAATAATAATVLLAASPGVQEYALLIVGALVGSMHQLAKTQTPTRVGAAWYILKWVGTAFILTFFVAGMIEAWFGIPAQKWPGVVAFAITFFADRWPEWVTGYLQNRFGKGDSQ